jgi:hypothetical protein
MGEMKKLEEVAKAIAAEDLDEGDGLYDWYALVDEVADEYRAMAKAAIEAMRGPTASMIKAVEAEEDKRGYAASAYECMSAEDGWPIMIDAALKE